MFLFSQTVSLPVFCFGIKGGTSARVDTQKSTAEVWEAQDGVSK